MAKFGSLLFPAALWMALPLCGQVEFTRVAPDQVTVKIDGKACTTFFLAPGGNKPYLYPLRTPSGVIVTRHFPMEEFAGETKDHPHHRGLFFSHGDVNGFNFWATEADSPATNKARMQPGKVTLTNGAKAGTITAVFSGQDPSGKELLTDTRIITFHAGGGARVIDYEIVMEPREKLTFADTKEGTFGVRLATSLSEDKTGHMVNAEGLRGEKNVWGKRSAWVDYSGLVDGAKAGVAIFDNPGNPRYPTYWHSRAYGLLAANIFGVRDFTGDKTQNGALTVMPGEKLRFRYRVVIHAGDTEAAGIANLFRQYTESAR